MQVTMREEGDAAVAMISGEIDHHTAQKIRTEIDDSVLEGGKTRLILDFSGVTFMDSSGVGLILGRRRLMEEGPEIEHGYTSISSSRRRSSSRSWGERLPSFTKAATSWPAEPS